MLVMKLFLFSASVFYLLGLKLTSKIELTPVFYHKPVTREASAVSSEKETALAVIIKAEEIKKDTVEQVETKSNSQTAPVVKTPEK